MELNYSMIKRNSYFLVIGLIFGLAKITLAQDTQITIAHDYQFDHQELPDPGLPIELRAYLMNEQDTSYIVKLILVKDGVFSEVYPKKIFLNEDDIPQYNFTVYAPTAGMKYRFVIDETKSSARVMASSDEFTVLRTCLPAIKTEKLTSIPRGKERLNHLVVRARQLETEIDLYTEAKEILNDILDEISKVHKEK